MTDRLQAGAGATLDTFEPAPIPMALVGADRILVAANRAFRELVGRPADALLGTCFDPLVHPADAVAVAAWIDAILAGLRDTSRFGRRLLRADGDAVRVALSGSPLGGARPRAILVVEDATEQHRVNEVLRIGEAAALSTFRQAEKALDRSQARFRQVFDHASDIVAVIGSDGVVRMISPSVQRVMGWSPSAVIGHDLFREFLHPDDLEPAATALALSDENRGDPVQFRCRASDGSWRSLEATGSAVPAEGGGPPNHVVHVRDMTERRGMVDALRQSEERFRLLFEKAPIAIGFARGGKNLAVNSAYVRLFGYDREEEVLERPISDFVTEPYRQPLLDGVAALIAGAEPREEYEIDGGVRRDGSRFCFHVRAVPVRLSDGPAVAAFFQDVTERRRSEEALRTAEATFRSLVEQSLVGFFVARKGRFTYVNRVFGEIFGYSPEEIVSLPDQFVLTQPGEAQRILDTAAEIADGRRADPCLALTGRHKDGHHVHMEVYATIAHMQGRRAIVGFIQDVTARRHAEEALTRQTEELKRSNAELRQFAYVASHDLQEPLRMIASYAQLLGRRYRGRLDSDADEFIGFMVQGVDRMQRLINDLLSYSRVETHGHAFEPTDCELVLQAVLANFRVSLEESGGRVTHDPLPAVRGDFTQLFQVLQNLVGNALKFHGAEPPIVHVSAARCDDGWEFSVRDNGIGIAPEYFQRIFTIFQRLHGPAEYPGTGIGLAICKRIVERHGGQIRVDSRPGGGSTFRFTIPDRGRDE